MKNSNPLNKYKKAFLIILIFLLALGISCVRYYFGPDIAFTLFFIFPIIYITWKAGIWAGIFISFTSALSLLITEIYYPGLTSGNIIIYLNNIFRFIIFLIITYIISELRISLDKQKQLARIDPLTLIPNRRAFYETANMEMEKARRYGYPVSLLSIDLDNFKNINDTFGHSTGDFLLKRVASTLLGNIRAIDLVTRLGGDEFGILLPQANANSAYIVADKLKQIISETMQKHDWPVTPSIGLIVSLKAQESVDDMIKKADMLMYSAKKEGGSRIKLAVVPG
jgi:diguanylate cyclase (GGDEF)-like protein